MSKNYNSTLQTNNSSLEEIITQLNSMPDAGDGLDTSDATASAGDILSGKTAYVDGEKITGTITTKTSSNLTASGATVTVPSGYYSTQATKAVTTATQATPTITVNSSTGLITATATQTAGYVTAGTKSATSQLAFQAAKTITPGTTNQTAVAANTYVGGTVTVKGDSNLVASNIVSGKSIFGVVGTATAGGGGGDTSFEDAFITRAISGEYTNVRVTTIGSCAFAYANLTTASFPICTVIYGSAFKQCSNLTTANFPVCTSIGTSAFYRCYKLTTVSFPKCTSIYSYAFFQCSQLTTVNFPACTSIYSNAFSQCSSLTTAVFPKCTRISEYAFYSCSRLITISFPVCTLVGTSAFYSCPQLTTVNFPACTSIYSNAFNKCSNLTTIYLMASTVCKLSNSNAFGNAGITSTTGSIFVPTSLVASYKAATNWTYFSNRIFGA